jgi:hypothetical protein
MDVIQLKIKDKEGHKREKLQNLLSGFKKKADGLDQQSWLAEIGEVHVDQLDLLVSSSSEDSSGEEGRKQTMK